MRAKLSVHLLRCHSLRKARTERTAPQLVKVRFSSRFWRLFWFPSSKQEAITGVVPSDPRHAPSMLIAQRVGSKLLLLRFLSAVVTVNVTAHVADNVMAILTAVIAIIVTLLVTVNVTFILSVVVILPFM